MANISNESYKIIHDQDQVLNFIKLFTPNSPKYVLNLMLFARRKYSSELSRGEMILSRIFLDGSNDDRNDENFGIRSLLKLYRLHVPIGSFVDNVTPISNNALALYALLDIKSPIKALAKTLVKCTEDSDNNKITKNPHKLFNSEIGNSNAYNQQNNPNPYVVIDLDSKKEEDVQAVIELFQEANVTPFIKLCVETKNGYHIVYEKDKNKTINRKAIYDFGKTTAIKKKNIKGKPVTDYWFSTMKQPTVIVPGTYQGGFKAIDCTDMFTQNIN